MQASEVSQDTGPSSLHTEIQRLQHKIMARLDAPLPAPLSNVEQGESTPEVLSSQLIVIHGSLLPCVGCLERDCLTSSSYGF